jgi:hypothetical protein
LVKCAPKATPVPAWEKDSLSLLKVFDIRKILLPSGWKLSKLNSRCNHTPITRQTTMPNARPEIFRIEVALFFTRFL